MTTHRFMRLSLLPLALLASLAFASAQDSDQNMAHNTFQGTLPDAPDTITGASQNTPPDTPQTRPQDAQPAAPAFSPSGTVPSNAPPEHASNENRYHISKWHGVLDPGDKVPHLTNGDKMAFWLHEEIDPVGALPALISSGYSQMVGSDPRFGGDAPAFGERFGAAMLREASMRFFSDSLIPTIAHEDPRYFRMAYGSDKNRALYATERVFIDRRDRGVRGMNFSDTLGRLAASYLTRTYYPERSANTEVVFKTWGYSLAGAVGDNLLLEFWPDVRDKVFHRHHGQP